MTYFAILSVVVFVAILYKARGVIGVILADAKMREGNYDGALRRLRWASIGRPNAVILHKQGLILALAGRPAEAESSYLAALDLVDKGSPYPRPRLLASRGFALIDLARYGDAERCFQQAIEAGDQTGNSHDGLAESRLVQGIEPDSALGFIGEAMKHAASRPNRRIPGAYHALQAWALAVLGRADEATAALASAERTPQPTPRTSASMHWRAGMALLAMHRNEDARRHFESGRDLDPRGKYGRRCAELI